MSEQIGDRKRLRRGELQAVRANADPTGERTDRLWSHVRAVPAVRKASVIMVFDAVGGEPEADRFIAWCRSLGKTVVVPAPERDAEFPVAPDVPDAVVVPGLGFTADGARLGRGGGWYDRFLAGRRLECVAIGVCFAEQVVDELPEEPHDIRVDMVVTDMGRGGAVRQTSA
ncbi:MAG: hypothetical protein CL424_19210 [Acidimicrobiaceae bacterium]|nr:hypothetical protein [Acidimicrobiaceae bacterium]